MNSDSAFVIGSTHAVCEDYAVCWNSIDKTYALIADGCSSSKDTDIGARVFLRCLELQETIEAGSYLAVQAAMTTIQALGLTRDALNCTSLAAVAVEKGAVASCYGDGVIVLGRRDDSRVIVTSSYESNAPNYPSYQLDLETSKLFHGQDYQKTLQYEVLDSAGVSTILLTTKTEDPRCTILVPQEHFQYVAIFSDGISSFQRYEQTDTGKTAFSISTNSILQELLAPFTATTGSFVQRRLKRFLKNCEEKGWHHSDDLSMGILWLD